MKSFIKIIFFLLIILIFQLKNLHAKNFRSGETISNIFEFNKDISIDLRAGNWTVVRKEGFFDGVKQRIVGIVRLENNQIVEMIEVYEGILSGYYTGYVDSILIEIVFKNKFDGCYERPEYFELFLYRKGNTFNCMIVKHVDVVKELNYPDDPNSKSNTSSYNHWIRQNEVLYPKIMLMSYHTYFSRIAGGNWYEVRHFIDPKILKGPKSNLFSEEDSEYHKNNINNFPSHKITMNKWISLSSDFHNKFENMSNTKKRHKLKFSKKKTIDNKNDKNLIDQLKNLNELFLSGALTKDEFEKAKKMLLN
jgi:hypothetical protein